MQGMNTSLYTKLACLLESKYYAGINISKSLPRRFTRTIETSLI